MNNVLSSIKRYITFDNAIYRQPQPIQENYYSHNLYFCTAAGALLCILSFIGMIGTAAPFAGGAQVGSNIALFVYFLIFAVNFISLLFILRERRLLKTDHRRRHQSFFYWFMGINMVLASMTFYTTQAGSSFFFEYILVTSIIYLLPNTDGIVFFRNAAVNIVSMILVLHTIPSQIAWQDLVDLIALHIICGVVNEARWRMFLQYENTKFSIERRKDELYKSSRTDGLTGLLNRTALRNDYSGYLNHELCVALLDVDTFKNLNDTYGHDYGDRALKLLGDVIRTAFQAEGERCYRYGGDEFLIISTDQDAQSFCRKLQSIHEEHDGNMHLSVSIGFCRGIPHTEDELRNLIRIADSYLYQAKNNETEKILGSIRVRDANSVQMIKASASALEMLKSTDEVARSFDQAQLSGKDWCIAYMNINQYSEINEAAGYRRGHEVLEQISRIIQKYFPNAALVNREVDHFVLLSTTPENEFVIRMRSIQEETASMGTQRPVILRIGVYHHLASDSPVDFITGMFKAKYASDVVRDVSKGDRYLCLYNAEMDRERNRIAFIHSHFQDALAGNRIIPYYQPIIGSISGKVCGFEALSRWTDPDRGVIPPGDYIPYLEQIKEVYRLDLYFLDMVCRNLEENRENFPDKLFVNVNVSRTDFEVIDMPEEIDRIVTRHGIPKRQIQFEITESAFAGAKSLECAVKELHARGYRVWMDDFGVGESSLSSFQKYEVEGVKLDQSFFTGSANRRTQIIIKSIVDLSHETDCMMIAEGVETQDQLWLARQWGINYIQGFYFSRPLPLENLLQKSFMNDLTSRSIDDYYQTVVNVSITNDFSHRYFFHADASLWLGRAVLEWDGSHLHLLRGNAQILRIMRNSMQIDGTDCVFVEDASVTRQLADRIRKMSDSSPECSFRLEEGSYRLCVQLFYLTKNPENSRTAYVLNITNFNVSDVSPKGTSDKDKEEN